MGCRSATVMRSGVRYRSMRERMGCPMEGLMRRRSRPRRSVGRGGRCRFPALLLQIPVLLDDGPTLLGTHLPPLAFQGASLLLGSLPKLLILFAHALLLLGRQALELSPAFAQLLALFRRHGPPLTEALLGALPLLRRHRQPAVAAFGERLLPLRREAGPVPVIALQQLLLCRRQGFPSARRRRRLGRSGLERRLGERRSLHAQQ